MKLSVVIPVYNEKDTVKEIIGKVLAVDLGEVEKEIIVVDDGSTDGTTDILKNLVSEYPQVRFHFKEKNKGKGDTLRIGFGLTSGDYVIIQDADLEYDPEEFKKLLRALEEENTDVVYGSRFSGNYEDMYTMHYYGNKLLTLFFNMIFGVMLTDMETCYKLMPGDFVRKIDLKSDRFDIEPEITAKLLKSGLRIKEVPISYKGRTFQKGKKITWVDGIEALFTLLKYRFFN